MDYSSIYDPDAMFPKTEVKSRGAVGRFRWAQQGTILMTGLERPSGQSHYVRQKVLGHLPAHTWVFHARLRIATISPNENAVPATAPRHFTSLLRSPMSRNWAPVSHIQE
jgi:hypothetical protein